jgi:hypothetical protein
MTMLADAADVFIAVDFPCKTEYEMKVGVVNGLDLVSADGLSSDSP